MLINDNPQFLKRFFSLSSITFISRITGLIREMVITTLLGTSFYSDVFYLAYSIPNLFRRFSAEGAMLTTFIPVFTKIQNEKKEEKSKQFVRNFFWSFFLLLSLFYALFLIFTPELISNIFARGFQGLVLEESVFLTRLMFCYIVLISLTAIYQGILNYHSIFFPSAFSPILLNILIVLGGFWFGVTQKEAALGLSIGVILGGLAQLFYSQYFVHRLGYFFWKKVKLFDTETRKVFQKMGGGLMSAGVYQLNIIIGYTIASQLYTGSIASLTISNRLVEFTLGIFVVSITTILLPELVKLITDKKYTLATKKMQEALLLSSWITLPATIGIVICGEYIIRILFVRGSFDEYSLQLTLQALFFHSLGIFFIGWNRILTSTFHSFQQFKKPAYLAFITMVFNAFLCWYLARKIGHQAIALASSASQVLLLFFNIFFLPKKVRAVWNKSFFWQINKQFLVNICLFVLLYYCNLYLSLPFYWKFLALFLLAVLTYLIICQLFKVRQLQNILYLWSKKNKNFSIISALCCSF